MYNNICIVLYIIYVVKTEDKILFLSILLFFLKKSYFHKLFQSHYYLHVSQDTFL